MKPTDSKYKAAMNGRRPPPELPTASVMTAYYDRRSFIDLIFGLGVALHNPGMNFQAAENIKVMLDAYIDMALAAPPEFMNPPLEEETIGVFKRWRAAETLPLH